MDCLIVGEAYNTHIDDLLACIRRAAARDEVLVVTSHDIAPEAKLIHMKTAWLEAILKTAHDNNVACLGFDELP